MTFAQSIIKPVGRNVRDLMLLCGVGPKLAVPDRRVLEQTIFPYLLGRDDFQRILFVGCHWYTWHYNTLFANKDYTTLEIDPARRRYGTKKHITDSIENITAHYADESLDVVMLLGVIGWGLDDAGTTDRSIAGIHQCLRPGGALILGCDDVPEHRPFPLADLDALKRFTPWTFPPLGVDEYRCDSDLRHTFSFFMA